MCETFMRSRSSSYSGRDIWARVRNHSDGEDEDDRLKPEEQNAEYVKNLLDYFVSQADGDNVIVIRADQECQELLYGLLDSHLLKGPQNSQYKVYIFKEGQLTNMGQGGWNNWAFSGKFKRVGERGETVIFSPQSKWIPDDGDAKTELARRRRFSQSRGTSAW